MPKSRSVRRNKRPMTIGPTTSSGECEHDEILIKQLEAAIHSQEILIKALDVICKRIASGEVSDNMLLRIMLTLAKSRGFF